MIKAVYRLPYRQSVGLMQSVMNFRDAKQHWGLEDFMNVTEQGVTDVLLTSLFSW